MCTITGLQAGVTYDGKPRSATLGPRDRGVRGARRPSIRRTQWLGSAMVGLQVSQDEPQVHKATSSSSWSRLGVGLSALVPTSDLGDLDVC